jgi:hypothetical protein
MDGNMDWLPFSQNGYYIPGRIRSTEWSSQSGFSWIRDSYSVQATKSPKRERECADNFFIFLAFENQKNSGSASGGDWCIFILDGAPNPTGLGIDNRMIRRILRQRAGQKDAVRPGSIAERKCLIGAGVKRNGTTRISESSRLKAPAIDFTSSTPFFLPG